MLSLFFYLKIYVIQLYFSFFRRNIVKIFPIAEKLFYLYFILKSYRTFKISPLFQKDGLLKSKHNGHNRVTVVTEPEQ